MPNVSLLEEAADRVIPSPPPPSHKAQEGRGEEGKRGGREVDGSGTGCFAARDGRIDRTLLAVYILCSTNAYYKTYARLGKKFSPGQPASQEARWPNGRLDGAKGT